MVTFQKLWDNHPTITGDKNPCSTNGRPNFSNQCAIRMGVCLARCGVDTSRIPGAIHCWHHTKSAGHVIRAEELAIGLTKYPMAGIHRMQEVDPKGYKNKLAGKRGVIFFKDYWQREIGGRRESFRNRSGDHIDLWNGTRLTDWISWVRILLGISDYTKSKSIWFWRVT